MNENPWALAFMIVAGCLVAYLAAIFLISGANIGRIRLALRCEWHALRDPEFGAKVASIFGPARTKEETKPSAEPLRYLILLQREGRLLDFLLEDIQDYADAQVGAAVRDIHRQCRAALKEHLVLAPVLAQPEGASVEVPAGFDPSAVLLTGNVTGQPPFRGTLRHHGWRARELKLAPPPAGQDPFILMPAEVELS